MSALMKALERSKQQRESDDSIGGDNHLSAAEPPKALSGSLVLGLAIALLMAAVVTGAVYWVDNQGTADLDVQLSTDLPIEPTIPILPVTQLTKEQSAGLPNISYQAHVVFEDASKNYVIINGQQYQLGDDLGDWRVDAIYQRELILAKGSLLVRLPALTGFVHTTSK